jgi:hypothetical protein
MENRKYHLHSGRQGAALAIRVTPRASRNEIVDVLSDGTVKVHITAPPVEGKANETLLRFLADAFDIPVSRLEIVAGANGRDKIISVLDMDSNTLHKKILEHLS